MFKKGYGDSVLAKTQAYEWYKSFNDCRLVNCSVLVCHQHLQLTKKSIRWRNWCSTFFSRVAFDLTFIQRLITGDETWMYELDMQTSQESSERRLPNELNLNMVHPKFLPEGQTGTKEFDLSIVKRLRETVQRPDLRENDSWILNHDKAPSHNAIIVKFGPKRNKHHQLIN